MTEQVPATSVELLNPQRLRLVGGACPPVPREHRLAMDRVWADMVRANPHLFDGPVVALTDVAWDATGTLTLSWAEATYRHHALRRVPGATALPSLFVAILQPTDEGGMVVARMGPATAAPGRWQLPGGSVEPPADHQPIDESELREQAARELREETGIDAAPQDFTLSVLTRGRYGSVGVLFHAPSHRESVIRERFAALVAEEAAQGRVSELDEIVFVHSLAELARAAGPHVDYLEPVLRRHLDTVARR